MCHHQLVKLSESLNMAALVEDNEATSKLMPLPEGKTFWDEGAFDAVVKRVEQGKRSLNDFMFMVEERAAIERRYADKLQTWYTKWASAVNHGPEFGDVEHVWLSALKEGSKIADIHFKMSSKLGLTHADGVMKNIYNFKHTHYHKQPLQKELKETKDCRDAFKSIQIPYRKAVENINKVKKKYLDASKLVLQHTSKHKDSTVSNSEKSKLDSLIESKEKAKCKYIEALNHFNDNIKDNYVREMKTEFQKSQELEKARMTVLLNSLHDFVNNTNQQTHAREPLPSIYNEALNPLGTVKPDRNLIQFSKKYGVGMTQNFPKFEDADLEPVKSRLLSSSDSSRRTTSIFADLKPPNPNILLNRLKHLRSDSQLRASKPSSRKDFMLRRPSQADSISSSAHGTDHQDLSRHSYDSVFTAKAIRKKSSEDSVLKETPASRDHYSMGNVYVRAISDFSATQREHLQITKGEVIYQIRGDERGWCYGRIACKEGIYPSNTVRLLTMNIFGV